MCSGSVMMMVWKEVADEVEEAKARIGPVSPQAAAALLMHEKWGKRGMSYNC